jgi:RNA-directed DNA polymerase
VSTSRSDVAKPFEISKWVVWEAYRKVKANRGAAGVDGESINEFERDLKGNLYKLWNRMSSGTYFPPPVLAVEIPKAGGNRVRVLGVPTVADRIAQTVVRLYLEPEVEPMFHPDSYGYRPGRSALDAVEACRRRCWSKDWVIDLDIRAFFDSLDHELVLKTVSAHTRQRWILLCLRRWLTAPAPGDRTTARSSSRLPLRPVTRPGQETTGAATVTVGRTGTSSRSGFGASASRRRQGHCD